MNKEIIKYFSSSLKGSEKIIIYEDMIVYEKSDLTIISDINDKPNKYKKIEIKDKDFVNSMILGNAYMPLKNEIIKKYNEVKNIEARNLHRPKNTARKIIAINDKELEINVDMYVMEYGDIFEKLVSIMKDIIFNEISK